MRFFVLILLVLLLPVRGGIGNAMAATGPHHGATQQHEQHEARTPAAVAQALLEDCADHQAGHGSSHVELVAQPANTGMATDASQAADAACDACSACQTCHALGLAFSNADVLPLPAPNAQPAAWVHPFASAPAARGQKPPIS